MLNTSYENKFIEDFEVQAEQHFHISLTEKCIRLRFVGFEAFKINEEVLPEIDFPPAKGFIHRLLRRPDEVQLKQFVFLAQLDSLGFPNEFMGHSVDARNDALYIDTTGIRVCNGRGIINRMTDGNVEYRIAQVRLPRIIFIEFAALTSSAHKVKKDACGKKLSSSPFPTNAH